LLGQAWPTWSDGEAHCEGKDPSRATKFQGRACRDHLLDPGQYAYTDVQECEQSITGFKKKWCANYAEKDIDTKNLRLLDDNDVCGEEWPWNPLNATECVYWDAGRFRDGPLAEYTDKNGSLCWDNNDFKQLYCEGLYKQGYDNFAKFDEEDDKEGYFSKCKSAIRANAWEKASDRAAEWCLPFAVTLGSLGRLGHPNRPDANVGRSCAYYYPKFLETFCVDPTVLYERDDGSAEAQKTCWDAETAGEITGFKKEFCRGQMSEFHVGCAKAFPKDGESDYKYAKEYCAYSLKASSSSCAEYAPQVAYDT